jgi:hypothetical protein
MSPNVVESRKTDGDNSTRSWVIDVLTGGLVGGALGWVVAVNLVIYMGVASGYEAGIGEVFAHSVILGVVVVGLLAAGPIVGVVLARRRRHRLR